MWYSEKNISPSVTGKSESSGKMIILKFIFLLLFFFFLRLKCECEKKGAERILYGFGFRDKVMRFWKEH